MNIDPPHMMVVFMSAILTAIQAKSTTSSKAMIRPALSFDPIFVTTPAGFVPCHARAELTRRAK